MSYFLFLQCTFSSPLDSFLQRSCNILCKNFEVLNERVRVYRTMVLYVYIVYLGRFRVYMGTFNEREITFWQTPDHIPDEGDFRA